MRVFIKEYVTATKIIVTKASVKRVNKLNSFESTIKACSRILIGFLAEIFANIFKEFYSLLYSYFLIEYCKNHGCCKEDTVGSVEFKGKYIFSRAAVNDLVTRRCVYGGGEIKRKCLREAEGNAQRENIDLEECKARSAITQALLDLQKV